MAKTNMEVKRMNRNTIFRYILKKDIVSKLDIAEALHLSVPTVAQGLMDLEEKGLVTEEGVFDSTGGRKAKRYSCIKAAKTALGVDITANHINIVMVDLAEQSIISVRKKFKIFYDNDTSYTVLKDEIEKVIYDSGVAYDSILGMGISLPAIIDKSGEVIYASYEKMKIDADFHHILSGHFSFPILLTNDANSGGRAEANLLEDVDDVIYFSLSQTVGGSIMINRQLFYGQNQRGGEFGHMTLMVDGPACYCGRKGCVDIYCSSVILSDETEGNLELFFRKVEEGEEKCVRIWDGYLDNLAIAVHNLYMVFDSDIIIGGYVGIHIGKYLEDLKERVKKIDTHVKNADFIRASKLKYEAPAIGAASIFIEEFRKQI
ncbi:ROK family transcriptional regulator [Kineothrix sedimenti]|uniref:ROK family protein n=1 Tax=Kineothrix sedimenti TaxID=3123317 RepID=A0ABZ3EYV2_9FIRM